ncbi:hypothetical protein CRU98_08075 [Arcobacter sp. CECT 8986]|uniref:coiled-coil domain-containing protein n=1 Tax=Arcobacter sp. CECT 8986 TaxID=2044507 RepID=UPI001009AC55|nr:hypothetical protein [Arcobacter sp. CECT 8986]RXJ98713.1 hypothetical protein CRU98_08075 [Arcobacter sp. CECT 8986]
MHDEKKEQLREVLNQNMSQESIHKKLNEEKQKQEAIKQSKQDKQKKLFYILFTIFTLIIVSFITYLFVSNDLQKNTNNIKQEINIEPKVQNKDIEKVKTLEEDISNKEDKKTEKTEEITKVEEKTEIKEQKADIKDTKEKIVAQEEKIKKDDATLVNEEKKEDKTLVKDKLKALFNIKKFNIVKCYDYDTFQKKPPYTCSKKIKKFVQNNLDSVRFEVIGIVGKEDTAKAKELSDKKDVRKYIINGISRDRVVEAFWVIKEITGEKNIILTPVNYNIISKESNKGIIIRAYKN